MPWLPLPLAADTADRLGGTLGVLAWRLGIRRRQSSALVTRCLGLTGQERQRVVRRSFASMGANFLTLFTAGGPAGPDHGAETANPGWLRLMLSRNRGAVFLTLHLGSWDVAGAVVARIQRTVVYAKGQHSARGDALINERRRALGMEVVVTTPGDRSTAITAMRALRDGAALGLMADQRPGNGEGHPVRFFGIPTWGHAGPGFFAARCRRPILPGMAVRTAAGRYRFYCFRSWQPAADSPEAAQRCADQIAAIVAALPGQYFWQHRRFAGPPPAVAERADEPWRVQGLRLLA